MLESSYETISKNRNLRILFLIDEGISPQDLMALISKNSRLWGGRYNPIVPVSNNSISDDWKQFIRCFDPDYIYHNANVDVGFAIEATNELGLNPIEILNLEEERYHIKGVSSQYLLPLINPTIFFQASMLWDWDNPLKEYYQLNYLIDESNNFDYRLIESHKTITIDKENIVRFDIWLHENKATNYSYLSTINTKPVILRLQNPTFRGFELIVATKENCFNELIYHWNKRMYDIDHKLINSLFVTTEQIDELIKLEHFKQTLFDSSSNENRIDIVSFSLEDAQLQSIRQKLQDYTAHNQFVVIDRFQFPFPIQDTNGHRHQQFKEKPTIQVNSTPSYFINIPVLSFNKEFYGNMQQYALDIQTTEIKNGERKAKKYPLNTYTGYFFRANGRADKSKRLVAIVDEETHEKSILDFNNVPFFKHIQQIITAPKILNERPRQIYSDCRYNDGSNRLAQFLKLFQNNFLIIEEFLHDKFWNDLFHELTYSNKVEGDTITFDEVFFRCYSLMVNEGVEFGEHPDTRFNIENLKLGLKSTLQSLIEDKVFLTGYVIKCKQCSSKIWHPLSEINIKVSCKGCSNENFFRAETPIAYKLNHLIKNNYGMKSEKGIIVPDGNLTTLNTLISLNNQARNDFEFLPQIDVYETHNARKPKTDLDIVCMVSGKLYIGECKNSSPLFFDSGNKSLNNLLDLAKTVKPDKIIISCILDENNKLDKAKKYLEHNIRGWVNKPEIIAYKSWEPQYHWPNNYKYFYY